ncbi:MAG: GNAT family N-acetyltransferase [Acetobacteraceae bacterium]|nr:GNAT family N-acetyltransferase [Acetobacteraceae bacterium]
MRSPYEFGSIDALPDAGKQLFAPGGGDDFFATRAWYETVIADALAPDERPLFLFAPEGALLPLRAAAHTPHLASLTTPYTCLFAPLVKPDLPPAGLRAVARVWGRVLRPARAVRLEALACDDARLAALRAGFHRAGLTTLPFAHFGNWHEPVAATGWPGYVAQREGSLRETIRRKLRRWEAGGDRRLRLYRTPDEAACGIAAYQAVYARSWKEPEPFPRFNPSIMRVAARQGVLRLGVLFDGERPVAAQFWVVSPGRATVLKLAHDEADKAASPGTVLTAMMIRHMLTVERVDEIDFGRGDDPYKRMWTSRRRQRMGIVVVDPLSRAGAAHLARHAAGALRRAVRREH